MRSAICSGLVMGLSTLACGRSDSIGFDAGVVAREPVEGCSWIAAYDRVVLRSATRAPAGCVVVRIMAKNEEPHADLQLPAGWILERATWRPTGCDGGWLVSEAGVVTASTVTGRLVLLPSDPSSSASFTSSDFELLLRFDSEEAPGQVEFRGVGTPLRAASCW
jgi:hypothetical protein